MRKKRGAYHICDEEVRAKIGRYAAENENKAAVTKLSRELGSNVP